MEATITDGPLRSTGTTGIGYIGYGAVGDFQCSQYSEADREFYFDSTFDVGGGITGIIGITTLVVMITAITMSCAACNPCCLKCMGGTDIVLAILSCVAYVGFASDFCSTYNCSFSTGAGLNILSIFVFVLGAVAFCMSTPYDEEGEIGGGPVIATPANGPATVAVATAAASATAVDVEAQGNPPVGSVQITTEDLPGGGKKMIKKTMNADGSMTVEETVIKPN